MRFRFRLNSVLALRQRERDIKQQLVARARADLAKLISDRDRLSDARRAVMDSLRILNGDSRWDVDQVIHRQRHATQLGTELNLAEAAIIDGRADLQTCLMQLVAVNQAVAALEKLAERRFAEHQESLAKSARVARHSLGLADVRRREPDVPVGGLWCSRG